jgi:hypothetical protein
MDATLLIILSASGIVILITFALLYLQDRWNRLKIKQYIEDKKGKLLSIKKPFLSPGWLFERDEIGYKITYSIDGKEHSAYAKTAFGRGVYITEE